jgi:prolyl 4-hydroxylase
MLKEKEFDQSSFIGGWYLDHNLCDELIDYYHYNEKYAIQGTVGTKREINKDMKESTDLKISAGNFDNIIDVYRYNLQKCLEQYFKKYEHSEKTSRFTIVQDYQFQKYPINGGFKKWHFENTGIDHHVFRHLVFMTYLNDVEDGGTEFYYQKTKTIAEKGLTLIWPATWTHTHRGVVSTTKEKMIITGWYSFINKEKQ